MRAFLGTNGGREFDKIVVNEILPAIARAYFSLTDPVEAPGAATNAVINGMHDYFNEVVEHYTNDLVKYLLTPDAGTDEKSAEIVAAWKARSRV
jgi:hypothetical protein